jgi:hypothetical protein
MNKFSVLLLALLTVAFFAACQRPADRTRYQDRDFRADVGPKTPYPPTSLQAAEH